MIHYKVSYYLNGSQWWCWNDKLHWVGGPAVIFSDGEKWWYLQNIKIACSCKN
jgi:hypothetical protein